jgi:hypothetical protein
LGGPDFIQIQKSARPVERQKLILPPDFRQVLDMKMC